ncbi:MAG: class II fructose-bisphosphate aldolase [Saprospiraceae bacterium]|nr:class II fructose-bisphosphate aldolase [Saprospiraceae bacterium]
MKFRPGVLYGEEVTELLNHANANNFALPAVNVIGTSSVNAVLETARIVNSPVIVQFGYRACIYYAGDALEKQPVRAAVLGGVSAALHIHTVAKAYGVPVILHTDHCQKPMLPWIDGLLSEGERFYEERGYPLFSSHMLDLSQEPLEENISTSREYLERMSRIGMSLEIELGATGGEEEEMDNTNIDNALLYTQPSEVAYAYKELTSVSDRFTIAASFGNVHGVYRPGNIVLSPEILKNSQLLIQKEYDTKDSPVNFVFHGGSGSSRAEIQESIDYGVIKMNINTDLQWAYWEGVKNYVDKNHDYLQGQIGNPDGIDSPNKKYYDPRRWMREGELSLVSRLKTAFEDLNCINRNI